MIREVNKNDLKQLLELYLNLHEKDTSKDSEHLRDTL